MLKKLLGIAVTGSVIFVAGAASAVQLELKYASDSFGAPTDAQIRNMPVSGFGPNGAEDVDFSNLDNFLNADPLTSTNFGVGGNGTDVDAMVFKSNKQSGSGLWVTDLDGIASIDVRFTYMGSEAGFKNFSVGGNAASGNVVFDNDNNYVAGVSAETVSFDVSGLTELWLPFLFETVKYTNNPLGTGVSAINDGIIHSTMQMGFLMQENGDLFTNSLGIENGSTIALFGDGTGDSDLDDMIVGIGVVGVTAVPIPAALPLLLTGLVGLGLLGRRKSKLA